MRFVEEPGQGRSIKLYILTSDCWKQAQHVGFCWIVKFAIALLWLRLHESFVWWAIICSFLFALVCNGSWVSCWFPIGNNMGVFPWVYDALVFCTKVVNLAVHQIRSWTMGHSYVECSQMSQVISKVDFNCVIRLAHFFPCLSWHCSLSLLPFGGKLL